MPAGDRELGLYYCYQAAVGFDEHEFLFGGARGGGEEITPRGDRQVVAHDNPVTEGIGCPAGYELVKASGAANLDYYVEYCVRSGRKNRCLTRPLR